MGEKWRRWLYIERRWKELVSVFFLGAKRGGLKNGWGIGHGRPLDELAHKMWNLVDSLQSKQILCFFIFLFFVV